MVSEAKSAGMRLIHTFELLELTLLHLVPISAKPATKSGAVRQAFRNDHAVGMKTLLQCQQVNKTFQSTIINSLPLRKALFFEQPIPWDTSKRTKKNAILMSSSWRVSPEIVVDVRARLHMSRKGQPPKISVQMEPKYDRGKTAGQQHS
ncbi:hypothetical protein HII31_11129 [Pseudocercospora fuligena]|uniref:Uncharacterized protein n=1 Tax=Pseudocercospora fuligena TaxID=685502 RepID=A0A8H6VI19_9PEZI|nr:hypothetical protein HII31_11129 [Pseudocercospora fuligena]